MKQKIRRAFVLLLCCAVAAGCLMIPASGSSKVYFMAVNDTIVKMTPDNMPIVVGGTLYIPYIMLSPRHNNDVNLGVTAQYSATRRTVLVSQGKLAVIFDPGQNTSYDLNGVELEGRAVVRNSMVYLPLDWLCTFFGTISYVVLSTPYGTLIRVTNEYVVLGDVAFVDAADTMLRDNYQSYLDSVRHQQNSGGYGPVPTGQPNSGPVVYLAFWGGDRADEVAQLLENHVHRGLFFFTAEEILQQDELIRRLVGAGHMVGLRLTGGSAAECVAQVERGRLALAEVARYPLTILRTAGCEEEAGVLLAEQGYAIWEASRTLTAADSLMGLLSGLTGEAPNYVEAPCDEASMALLTDVVATLSGSGYRLRQAVAPVL